MESKGNVLQQNIKNRWNIEYDLSRWKNFANCSEA